MDERSILQMTADIVAAHASLTEMSSDALVAEIGEIYNRLARLAGEIEGVPGGGAAPAFGAAAIQPALPLEAAFRADRVFCMICGKGLKTLKRHLSTAHALTPGQYRRQFGIPAGTALVAKRYSEARRKLAQDLNLAEGLAKARAVRAKKKKKA